MDGQDKENIRIYNQGDFTKRGTIRRRQEVLLVECQERRRRNHSRPRIEDELWPFPPPRCWRSNYPTIPPDCWRRPHKGPVLKPASLPNSLYWAYWVWVWICSHLQWKEPPKTGPYTFLLIFFFFFFFLGITYSICVLQVQWLRLHILDLF